MEYVFFLGLIAAFGALLLGLVRPSLVLRKQDKQSRGRVLLVYGAAAIVCFFGVGITGGRPDAEIEPDLGPVPTSAFIPEGASDTDDSPVPAHTVAARRDLSYGNVRRMEVRVSLPEHYDRSGVQRVADHLVAETRRADPINALSILFYGPNTSTEGAYDVAKFDWAPDGRWEDAGSVAAGNYSSFAWNVDYNEPRGNVEADAQLTASSDRGLFSVTLPEGATLVDRTAADPARGRDASEQYSLNASDAQIEAFFIREMVASGWQKEGPELPGMLVFSKGGRKVAVLTSRDAGTFSLMGSESTGGS